MEPAKDYNDDITEEAVLSRWDKTKQWWSMGSAAVQVIKWGIIGFKMLFVTSAAAVVVGEVTDTKPLRTAAVEIGMIETAPIDTTKGMLQEELTNQLATLQQEINDLKTHNHDYPDPPVLTDHVIIPPHPYAAEDHDHAVVVIPAHPYAKVDHDHEFTAGLTPAMKADIMKEIETMIPPGHLKLH